MFSPGRTAGCSRQVAGWLGPATSQSTLPGNSAVVIAGHTVSEINGGRCPCDTHWAKVETFVKGEAVAGAVRTSVAGMGHRRSLEKVRSNLIAKVRTCCDVGCRRQGH